MQPDADVSSLCRDVTSCGKEERTERSSGGATAAAAWESPPRRGARSVRNALRSCTFQGSGAPRCSARPTTRLHPPSSIINSNVPPLFICVWIATRFSKPERSVRTARAASADTSRTLWPSPIASFRGTSLEAHGGKTAHFLSLQLLLETGIFGICLNRL